MAAGKINLKANDGAVVGLVVPDGLGSGERQIALGVNLSGITAYHLLEGNLSVSNEVLTNGFSTTLYTGNGSTQSINTGIDMNTQWGNSTSEKFGGLVWLKSRSAATNNFLFDTVRGTTKEINSNTTEAEATLANSLTAFSSTGMTVGSAAGINVSAATYTSWNFQTTHIKTGTTNHGKAYTCHYNPFTGFTIVKYEGSGIAGHEIPHHLGRKLDMCHIKDLSFAGQWLSTSTFSGSGYINLTNALLGATTISSSDITKTVSLFGARDYSDNWLNDTYIMYGWANSYYDEADKLIGNYEVGVYQGTGVAGNKVTTRGKPAWVMIKRIDNTGGWFIHDNIRNSFNTRLEVSASVSDETIFLVDDANDGFIINNVHASWNASGGQYLYMVVYDNDSGSGKSKYPRATDSSQLQLNTALVPFANGIDSNGAKNTIVYKNETITGVTLTAGKNYVYAKNDGTYGVKDMAPSYGKDNPLTGDFYNVLTNKWYSNTNTEITESRNYLDAIVHADANGQVAYVEELPKIEYKDIVKANEFQGKNACTAWANIDMTTTPPTIRDSYEITGVIRTATGRLSGYVNMDRNDYIVIGNGEISQDGVNASPTCFVNPSRNLLNTTSQFNIEIRGIDNINYNAKLLEIFIIGGKN